MNGITTSNIRLELVNKLTRRREPRGSLPTQDTGTSLPTWPITVFTVATAALLLGALMAWVFQAPPQVPLDQPLFW